MNNILVILAFVITLYITYTVLLTFNCVCEINHHKASSESFIKRILKSILLFALLYCLAVIITPINIIRK